MMKNAWNMDINKGKGTKMEIWETTILQD
jgi:hypothetical protein